MNEYEILGVKISDISIKKCFEIIDNCIKNNKKIHIVTTNNEFIVDAQNNTKFKEILNKSDLSIPDSTGVVWAVRRLFNKNIQRIPGIDLFLHICEIAPKKNYRIFLLGGNNNISLKTKKILQKKFIGIHIVGNIDGIKIDPKSQNMELISEINQAKPDILAVALGAPKQELWIDKNKSLIHSNVFIGLGGTFDYISGEVLRAPRFFRNVGLEWLFRLFIQPSRIGRIYKALIKFPLLVIFYGKKN